MVVPPLLPAPVLPLVLPTPAPAPAPAAIPATAMRRLPRPHLCPAMDPGQPVLPCPWQ